MTLFMRILIDLTAADDGMVVIWDLSTGEEVQTISCLFNGPVSTAIWINLPKRRSICLGCADGTIHIYQQLSQGVRVSHCTL
jgi:WD40 repeat protein